MNLKSFLIRLLVALVMGPLLLFIVYKGQYYLLTLVLLIAVFSLKEFFEMASKKNADGHLIIAGVSTVVIILGMYYASAEIVVITLLLSLIGIFFKEIYHKHGSPLLNLSVTMFGIVYTSMLTGSFILLREIGNVKGIDYAYPGGWLIMIFLTTWLCDTAAYVYGSYFGKHKLIVRISPNKSIEGTVAGFLGALAGAAICHFWFVHGLTIINSLIIGAIIGSFGQYGDLFESMLKRDAGVKDSSTLIPGHGGIMDRFDSLLLSIPIIFMYLNFIVFR